MASTESRTAQPSARYLMFEVQQVKSSIGHPTMSFDQVARKRNEKVQFYGQMSRFFPPSKVHLHPIMWVNKKPHAKLRTKPPAAKSVWMDWRIRKWLRRIGSGRSLQPITRQNIRGWTVAVAFAGVNAMHWSLRWPLTLCRMRFARFYSEYGWKITKISEI